MAYTPDTLNFSPSVGTPGLASADSYWRILEYSGYDLDGSSPYYDVPTQRYSFDAYPWFGAGRVAADGSLTGFPSSYTPSGNVPGVIPPAALGAGEDFSMTVYVQTGCLDSATGMIHWHQYSSSDPDGDLQLFRGYRSVSPASDWP